MGSARLTLLLSMGLSFSVVPEQVQVPTLRPEMMAGPWESPNMSGIDGVFFRIETSSAGPSGNPQIAWQSVEIRVYHRQGGNETWGWFATNDKATPESYNMQDDRSFTLFDGERMRIHFADVADLKPFDLDISFSPTAHVWKGTWSRSGQAFDVVLERPNPATGVIPSAFIGDWEGEPGPNSRPTSVPGSLHIRESSDGVLSAWLDRTFRNGELLRVISATDAGLVLRTTNSGGATYQYRGSLSQDRRVLTGIWVNGLDGRLNAPDRFRRTP
jgi:hypothetical protein